MGRGPKPDPEYLPTKSFIFGPRCCGIFCRAQQNKHGLMGFFPITRKLFRASTAHPHARLFLTRRELCHSFPTISPVLGQIFFIFRLKSLLTLTTPRNTILNSMMLIKRNENWRVDSRHYREHMTKGGMP